MFSSRKLFPGIAAAAATAGLIALTSGGTSQVHATAVPGRTTADVQLDLMAHVSSEKAAGYGSYTVRSGDTLSSISRKEYGSGGCWPGIWAANAGKVTDPNYIYPGEGLAIPSGCSTQGPAAQNSAVTSSAQNSGSSGDHENDGDSDDHGSSQAPPPPPNNGYQVSSSFQACVIRAESGGNPYIWNASGHWGLYQFSYSTWVAHGGVPGDFGHAGPAEQTAVFWQTVHDDGTSDWAPYDGC